MTYYHFEDEECRYTDVTETKQFAPLHELVEYTKSQQGKLKGCKFNEVAHAVDTKGTRWELDDSFQARRKLDECLLEGKLACLEKLSLECIGSCTGLKVSTFHGLTTEARNTRDFKRDFEKSTYTFKKMDESDSSFVKKFINHEE